MLKVGSWLYASVTRLLPSDMRESVGRDLVQAFEDQCRVAAREGRSLSLLAVWVRGFLNLSWTVLAERSLIASAYLRRAGGGLGASTIVQDVRLVIRSLLRAPGFTAIVLTTLAVAMGANTAIFSVVEGVLLRPLPYPDADRIVTVATATLPSPGGTGDMPFSDRGYWHFVNNNRAFDGFGGYMAQPLEYALTGDGEPLPVNAGVMTPSAFQVLGTLPQLGRLPTVEDATLASVTLLSHGLWVSRYGSDPSIVGRDIELTGRKVEVIGVLPEGYDFPTPNLDIWLPLRLDPESVSFGVHNISGIARLAPGDTVEAGVTDAERLVASLGEAGYPSTWLTSVFSGRALVRTLKEQVIGDARRPLLILLGAVGFVLLIACSNVANLFLVRAEARTRERAVRIALGSGRGRLVRQVMAESVLLALIGGAAGILLAYVGTMALVAVGPSSVPRLDGIGLSGSALLYTGGISVLAGLLFGVLPALRLGPDKMLDALRDGGRATIGRDRHRTRSVLVVAQVALALVLLVGSGLMVRSFQELRAVDPGFQPEGLLTFTIVLFPPKYGFGEPTAQFYDELIDRLEDIPAVASVGGISALPLTDGAERYATEIYEFPPADDELPPFFPFWRVTPGYFETMGIPVVEGRSFTADDHNERLGSVIISQSLKDRYWPQVSALGKRIQASGSPARSVGVVGDVHAAGLGFPAEPHIYKPMLDAEGGDVRRMTMVVRSDADPLSLVPAVRDAVATIDPDLPISNIRSMESLVADSMSRTSFIMSLLLLAAIVSLFLGSVGIYGVISYIVSQRTSEIGVRLALGADSKKVRRMVLVHGMKLAGAGVVIGLLATAVMGRLLTSLLYGVTSFDPLTLVGGSVIFLIVAALASSIPARRAACTSPATALQST
jgi:predicted permease